VVTVTVRFVPVASYNQKTMRPEGNATRGAASGAASVAPPGNPPRSTSRMNTVPPGLTVSCLPLAQGLAQMVTVTVLPAAVRVPDDGETFT
jgi:hypothetical protein